MKEKKMAEDAKVEAVVETPQKSVFETLNNINCNSHTEEKNGLTYLSWAWAWAEVKKAFPNSYYTIYENKDGLNYHTDGRTAWVKTGVTVEGLELIEFLPVMDNKNLSIPLDKVTSFNVNKAIQRSLTKACARHGLGLYIYAGEDLPECDKDDSQEQAPQRQAQPQPQPQAQPQALTMAQKELLQALCDEVLRIDNVSDLTTLWNNNPEFHKVKEFYECVSKRGNKLKSGAK